MEREMGEEMEKEEELKKVERGREKEEKENVERERGGRKKGANLGYQIPAGPRVSLGLQ